MRVRPKPKERICTSAALVASSGAGSLIAVRFAACRDRKIIMSDKAGEHAGKPVDPASSRRKNDKIEVNSVWSRVTGF